MQKKKTKNKTKTIKLRPRITMKVTRRIKKIEKSVTDDRNPSPFDEELQPPVEPASVSELADDEEGDEIAPVLPELQTRRYRFKVEEKDEDQRLDVFLQERVSELSRTRIQDLIECFLVRVNDKVFKQSYHVQTADTIDLVIPPPEPIDIEPEPYPLDILYEDSDIIVLNKKAGVTVHPVVGQYSHTLVNYVLAHCKDLSGIGGKLRPGVVHRLDKDTSGIMVMAKNDQAHWGLTEQFKNRTVEKTYFAVVKGIVPYEDGFIRRSIIRDPRNRKRMAAVDDLQVGKHAETLYWVLERFSVGTFLRIKILTGRTHQIRVHFSSMGHTLFGDPIYQNRLKPLDRFGLALCSKEFRFTHPRTGEDMYFQIDLPDHFEELLAELRRDFSGRGNTPENLDY